jgi:hypothetical protein
VLPDRLQEEVELPEVNAEALRTMAFGTQVSQVPLEHLPVDPVQPGDADLLAEQ